MGAMDISITDFNVFLYNYAVALSGGFVTMRLGIDERETLFGLMFVFAIIWTIYFRLDMSSRLMNGNDEESA